MRRGDSMNINHLHSTRFEKAYGILCSTLNRAGERKGVYPTLCRVPVGGSTLTHSHFEAETFYIISGCGQVLINSAAPADISAGDVLQVPPHAQHQLLQSGSEELVLLSVYSEDFVIPALSAPYLVTAAPPTPNGPLHLGHMSGPYLASDVVARYLRARGQAVRTHCGTDDHQNYVQENTREAMRTRVMKGLEFMQIEFDEFVEPKTDQGYQAKILRFYNEALHKGVIRKEVLELPHCQQCNLHLIDALIEGDCPHCHSPSRGGCESCGMVVPPQKLKNAHCTRCGSSARTAPVAVQTFDLGKYFPAIAKDVQQLALPQRLQALLARVAEQSALKVIVSHPNCGGIAIPNSDLQLHVWFEMAAHYQEFALSAETWVHHFGFDNAFYYLAYIPALLKAVNSGSRLPQAVVANEFLQLEGQKFSTSRGHAIWADEVDANSDYLRLYLCHERPVTLDADFSMAEYQAFAQKVDRLVQSLFVADTKNGGGPSNSRTLTSCNRFTREMESFYYPETLDLRRAARRILEFLDAATCASGSDRELMTRVLATAMAPILPQTAQALGVRQPDWICDWTVTL